MGITGAQAPVRLPFGEDGLMPAVSIPQPGKPSRLAYVRSFSDVNIYKVETPAVGAPASAQPSVAIASTRIDRGARFSPDGRRVAFTSDRSGWPEIWISDPDGSGAAQLTFLKAPNAAVPTWSPDGQTIAFESNAEGQNEIYSMSSGGGKPQRLTTHPANDKIPSFSRDGKWIYFHSNRGGENQIWKVPAAGGEPQQVTSNTGNMALESIDGAWLYYTLFRSLSSLWRIPASGGPAEKILDSIFSRGFDVVEQGIYYLEPSPSGGIRLQFFQFGSRKSTHVTQLERKANREGPFSQPGWAHDPVYSNGLVDHRFDAGGELSLNSFSFKVRRRSSASFATTSTLSSGHRTRRRSLFSSWA